MTYFIDHITKKIHRQRFAGDLCGFLTTPIEKREFTASQDYIKRLEENDVFTICPYCQSVQLLTEKVHPMSDKFL
ncbi:hypothetical protein [Planococcus beigongshangi]|uniref:hypothetical protein n=1 Tax=Planococcus beigongshangi TaxID=2782536 RepID=UPI00193BDBD5|nr:hypothetical protein [Planococcus beigongshangi]